ncbi:MAG: hypothetical protein D6772_15610 [Bacteroidetes bacterium]|nr:MAG: hypothetical protein D6772_15610 [Bacteroidota bacterium]
MRLLSRILLFFVFAGAANLSVQAQCAWSAPAQNKFLTQSPKAKAAMIAAASPEIEERVDPSTGELYYVRRVLNPWSEVTTYQIVYFNPRTEQFESGSLVGETGRDSSPDQGGRSKRPCPQSVPRDSSQQRPQTTLPAHQPRRSSTIKIAERF